MAQRISAREITSVATEDISLGDAGLATGSLMIVELYEYAATLAGTITIKAKAAGSGTARAIPYKRRHLGGAVSDDTIVAATITTFPTVIEINAAGMTDIVVSWVRTGGTLGILYYPVLG